ncbi:MAG TPA: DUF5703 domain-containing protein [Luteolibacter sp.]|nr:DUF5703 domain-containing protein [Luteolibacter sp.]
MMQRFSIILSAIVALAASFGAVCAGEPSPDIARYNVVWTSQSENSAGSMPCVGGDIGLNVWVEKGELFFLIGRAGCRDENGSLLKLGRVRLQIDPSPFAADAEFRQELRLQDGQVWIHAARKDGNSADIRLWVEIDRPVVHAEVHTSQASKVEASYESWRHQRIELPNTGKNLHRGQCLIHFDNYPGQVFVEADDFRAGEQSIRFWHRMKEDRNIFHHLVKTQGLEAIADKLVDPCRNLTFGGELSGRSVADGTSTPFVRSGETAGEYALTPFKGWRYRSQVPAKEHRIDVVTLIEQAQSLDAWHASLDAKVQELQQDDLAQARQRARQWWDGYWARSHLRINPTKDASDPGWRVARNYNLFRYMLASGLNGREPIMFNGGVLTFDPIYAAPRFKGPGYTPDHRQWGSALTAQNQRCMYWPMLKSGDFDLIKPGFDYYREGLTNARERTRHYWGHDGCSFTEQTTIQWLPGAMVYGYAGEEFKGKTWRYRPPETEPGVCANSAVSRLYDGQLEWSWMILQYHRFTGVDISAYLPFIEQSVIFYDEHYRMREKRRSGRELTAEGKLQIEPTNALEGHPKGANPTSVIAGLRRVLGGLIELNPDASRKQRWEQMLARLPDMPTAVVDGRTVLIPTTQHANFSWHMPSMYPLYPYEIYQLGSPGLSLMRDTFLHGIGEKERMDHRAWIQGVVHFAHLGMSAEAQQLIARKLADGPYRFPAFWPPDIDHAPDHNWGGMGMIGLQEMLMQTGDERILLLPAWPKDWEVEFKLHAPGGVVVEASAKEGKVTSLKVTPGAEGRVVEWAACGGAHH